MSIGRNVWIYAKRNARNLAQSRSALCQSPKFRFALHIEQQNPGFQRRSHLVTRLSHAGEHDLPGSAVAGGQQSLQFSARNYVKAAPLPRQQTQNTHIRICLDGVADGVGNVAKGFLKSRQPLVNRCCRINVQRRSVALGQFGQRNIVAVQH